MLMVFLRAFFFFFQFSFSVQCVTHSYVASCGDDNSTIYRGSNSKKRNIASYYRELSGFCLFRNGGNAARPLFFLPEMCVRKNMNEC